MVKNDNLCEKVWSVQNTHNFENTKISSYAISKT